MLNDIREAHRTDKTTADVSGSEQVKQSIEELRGFEGSDAEKSVDSFVICFALITISSRRRSLQT